MAVKVMVAPSIAKGDLAKATPKPKSEAAKPKRRRSSVYDADGNEVFITLLCLKCQKTRPLSQFGLRRMADGAIRNQPWCRACRSASGADKPRQRPQDPAETVESPVSEGAAATASPAAEPKRPAGSVAAEVAAALAAGLRR